MKNAKNLGRRGLSLLLVLLMCMSMLQFSAFATDETETPDEEIVLELPEDPVPSETPEGTPDVTPEEIDPDEPAGETPAETPDEPAGETSAETPDEPDGETPAETPDEPAGETPAETPDEPAGETPAETPDEPAGETPAETPDEPAGETPAETPDEPSKETPVEPAKPAGDVVKDTNTGVVGGVTDPIKDQLPMDLLMPAIQASETFADQDITVEVSAPEGAFPDGTTVSIVPVPELPMAFDITFRNRDGDELQPANGLSVDVNFSVPNPVVEMGFASAVLEVVHITDEENWTGETVSSQEITADDGSTVEISAQAESFSVYAAKVSKAKAGGDSYGTNGAAVRAALEEKRAEPYGGDSSKNALTRSAYDSFYPWTDTYNVCWGWNAEDGYGAVEFTEDDAENATATDVVWTTYYDSHFLGEPKGYKWIVPRSSNSSVAWAEAEQIEVAGKQALKVTIHRGTGGGRAIIEIGFTVTEMDVKAGIAWDYQTFSDTNGYLYYIVDNEGEKPVEPDYVPVGDYNQVHEVYLPVGGTVTIEGLSPRPYYVDTATMVYATATNIYGQEIYSPQALYPKLYGTIITSSSMTASNGESGLATITGTKTTSAPGRTCNLIGKSSYTGNFYVVERGLLPSTFYEATIQAGNQVGTTELALSYNCRVWYNDSKYIYADNRLGWNSVSDRFIVHVYDPETVTIPVGSAHPFSYPETALTESEFKIGTTKGSTGKELSTPRLINAPAVTGQGFSVTDKTNLNKGQMTFDVTANTANRTGTATAIADYTKSVYFKDGNDSYYYDRHTIYSYKVNVKSTDGDKWTLTFDKNTTDTVNKMPTPNPMTDKFEDGKNEVTVKLPDNVPERDGYTFQGWGLDPKVAKGQYQPGDDFTIKKDNPDVTLYAIWSKNPDEGEKPPKDVIDKALEDLKVIVSCGTESNHTTPAASKTMTSDLKKEYTPIEHYDPVSKVYTLIYTAKYTDYSAEYEQFVRDHDGPDDLTHRLVNPLTNATSIARLVFVKDGDTWKLDSTNHAYFAVTCGDTAQQDKVTVTKTRTFPTGNTLNLNATTNHTISYQITVSNNTDKDWTGTLTGGIVEGALGADLTGRTVTLYGADNNFKQITLNGNTTSQFTVKARGVVTMVVTYTAVEGDVGRTLFNEVKSANPSTYPEVVIENKDPGIKITNTYEYTLKYDRNDGTTPSTYRTVTQTSDQTSAMFPVGEELKDSNWTKFPDPARDGWTFLGWAETASATQAMTATEVTLTSTNPTKTLYAVWQVNDLNEDELPPILTQMIRVHCSNADAKHEAQIYDLLANTANTNDSYEAKITRISNNSFSVSLNVKPQRYVDMFNTTTGYKHEVPASWPTQTVVLTKGNDGAWTVTRSQRTKTVNSIRAAADFVFDFEVECTGKPTGSDITDDGVVALISGKVNLVCDNPKFTETHKYEYALTAASCAVTNFKQNDKTATATLTVTADSYLTQFNTQFTPYTHAFVNGKNTETVNLTLTFTPDGNGGGTWAVDDAVEVTFNVVCTTYNLTYDANGGEGAPVDGTDYNAGSTATLATTPVPTRKDGETDLVFKGWSLTKQETVYGSDATIPDGVLVTQVTMDSNKTVYAVWQQPGSTQQDLYKLIYDANGGNADSVPATLENLPANSSQTLVKTPAPTHADVDGRQVEFIGWTATKTDGIYAADAEAPVTIDRVTIVDKDVTVYAAWRYADNGTQPPTGSHTVTWIDGYNNTQIDQVTVDNGDPNPAADSRPVPNHPGYSFTGWTTTTDGNGNVTYTANFIYNGNNNNDDDDDDDDDDNGGGGGGGTPVTPDQPPVNIPEEEPPLAELPEEPAETPDVNIPEEEPPLAEIPEEDVPLADVPKTSDGSIFWAMAALLSGLGLALLGKKREDEEA